VLFAQGSYVKGATAYSLAGSTVQETVLSNTEYRLDFQNIQAVNPLNGDMVIISGYYEGEMN
jgi:Na+-transporting NADH:ubiquinone oxidoreductase subunit NqrA